MSMENHDRHLRPHRLFVLAILLALLAWPGSTVATGSRPGGIDLAAGAEAVSPRGAPATGREMVLPGEPQGTLVRALTAEPSSLDLPQTTDIQAFSAAWQLYDSLVWVDDDGWVVPALAESWQVAEDGTEYTFRLRQGVTFHNGEPFNADAVVFSWERASQGDFPRSAAWEEAVSVTKSGDYTVTVRTEEADGLFLRSVANNWAMIPPVYYQSVGQAGFEAHPIGTGPFQFVDWVAGDQITMEANPDYWREGLPRLQTIIFRPIPASADRLTAIQTGAVDMVSRLSREEAQSLAGVPGVKVLSYPLDRVYYIAFNNLTTGVGKPTEDAAVRQAMNYAVDVEGLIDEAFDGFARQSTGFVTPSNLGYDNARPFGHDTAKARQLLSQAGYSDGFEIDMACPTGAYSGFEQVCGSIVDDLGEAGITVNLEFIESGSFWDLEAAKQLPPLFGDSWAASVGEALPRLQGALGGWDVPYSAWSDPVLDGLLDAIATETDQEQRAALYGQLQVTMRQDPPFIYLYEPFAFEAIDVDVQDYAPRADEHYFLRDVWFDTDGDGVLASVEDDAPNEGDGNADGIPDRDQENVASLPNASDGRYVTLALPEGSQLSGVAALENPSPGDAPPTATFPLGFFAFEVVGIEPGSSVSATLVLPLEPEMGTYWRYGPTPDDPSDHWYPFAFDGTTGAQIVHEPDRTRITLTYVDGARGDSNLVADGRIVDPGAPAIGSARVYLPLTLR